jgi:NAD(P)-dependent dehydrogenase (short-subunit alcohol dehydrogenase family)
MDRQKGLMLAGLGLASWCGYRIYRASSAFRFPGKTVFVTGGTRGLGLVIARQLAREEANLAVCSRYPDEVRRAEEDLSRLGARVLARTCDLRYQDRVRDFVDEVRRHFGAIDVLINNAGTIGVGPVETMALEDFYDAGDQLFRRPAHDPRSAARHAAAGSWSYRERHLDRRQGKRAALAALLCQQVRPGRAFGRFALGGGQGWDRRHDDRPRPDAHGQPAQRDVQRPA